jgi:HEPN domain-containing protein
LSFEEAEVLRERAEAFLENAKHLIKRGSNDLAAFNLEQHCQLLVKYKLLTKTGTYSRTHSLIRLAAELAKLEPQIKTLVDREDDMLLLTKLEDAYIGAKYLPRRYGGHEVEAMLRFVVEVFKPVVERV